MVDWNDIKIEYITGTMSYRELSKKHGVPLNSLYHHGKTEGWVELRRHHRDNLVSKACEKDTDYRNTLYDLALRVARQLDEMTNNISVTNLAAAGIKPRDITGAIKDLEDILHVKSAADAEEQAARIAKLRREAMVGIGEDSGQKLPTPVFLEDIPKPGGKADG